MAFTCSEPIFSPNSLMLFVEFTRCRPGSLGPCVCDPDPPPGAAGVDERRPSRKSLMVRDTGKYDARFPALAAS